METNAQPLHLIEQRSDGSPQLVVHATQLQELDLCVTKFWYHYVRALEASAPRPALNYGTGVHEALAYRYSHPTDDLASIEAEQMGVIERYFTANPQPPDEWRNGGRAQALIRAYNAQYPTHDWQVAAVEEEFEVEVGRILVPVAPSDERSISVPVILRGRKDLVVEWHGGLWVVDHKTAQDWAAGDSNSHLDEGRMSFQFRAYAFAERAMKRSFHPILGTVGNYLVSRKPLADDGKPRKSSLPRNQFHMEAYPYTDADLDEWRDECLAKARRILAHHADNDWELHRNRGSCGHWGRCEFYDVCSAQPADREPLLATSDFVQRQEEAEGV